MSIFLKIRRTTLLINIIACVLNLYAGNSRLVSTDYDGESSLTRGIQEALDALPEDGGEVYVPPGTYPIFRPLQLKPGTILSGAGRGSIIRKSPNFKVTLTEDVRKGAEQNYVVVDDVSRLKPGMYFTLMDSSGLIGGGSAWAEIEVIEGNKVYLIEVRKAAASRNKWKPERDYLVNRQACLMHIFGLLVGGARHSVIRNLAFDGNKEEQKIDGQHFYKGYHAHTIRNSRCLPYLAGGAVVQHCQVYDAVQVNISLGGQALIENCDIYGAAQGIHAGSGTYSRIVGNRIYGNWESGIYMCMGNHSLVISENQIYRNGSGIGELGTRTLGSAEEPLRRDGDHYCIIANNIIYENTSVGIGGQQGREGAEDFVITGNIIYNNHTAKSPSSRDLGPVRSLPAGISLYNAKRCMISNNRIFDDQDIYVSELYTAVGQGAKSIQVENVASVPMCDAVPRQFYPCYLAMESASNRVSGLHVQAAGGRSFHSVRYYLDEPLTSDFPRGTIVRLEKTQPWGIIVAGPAARDNLIVNNICIGNREGGIIWQGAGSKVEGNLGEIVCLEICCPLTEDVVFRKARMTSAGVGLLKTKED